MFENKRVPIDDPRRFRVEVQFSPGTSLDPYTHPRGDHVLPTTGRIPLHQGSGLTLEHLSKLVRPYSAFRHAGAGAGIDRDREEAWLEDAKGSAGGAGSSRGAALGLDHNISVKTMAMEAVPRAGGTLVTGPATDDPSVSSGAMTMTTDAGTAGPTSTRLSPVTIPIVLPRAENTTDPVGALRLVPPVASEPGSAAATPYLRHTTSSTTTIPGTAVTATGDAPVELVGTVSSHPPAAGATVKSPAASDSTGDLDATRRARAEAEAQARRMMSSGSGGSKGLTPESASMSMSMSTAMASPAIAMAAPAHGLGSASVSGSASGSCPSASSPPSFRSAIQMVIAAKRLERLGGERRGRIDGLVGGGGGRRSLSGERGDSVLGLDVPSSVEGIGPTGGVGTGTGTTPRDRERKRDRDRDRER